MSKTRLIKIENIEHIVLNDIKEMDLSAFEGLIEFMYGVKVNEVGDGDGTTYDITPESKTQTLEDIFGEDHMKLFEREDGKPVGMPELGERNYTLISRGVKMEGSYNPEEIMCAFEEELYVHEYDEIREFLQWCHDNEKGFGRGNYEERFKEFKDSKNKEE